MTPTLIPPVQFLKPPVMGVMDYSGKARTTWNLTLSLQQRLSRSRSVIGPSVHRDAEYQCLLAHIKSLKGLPENWDGYGADGISGKVVTCTLFIISLINSPQYQALPLPEISPETNGTISMSWESSKGEAYLEIGETRYAGYIQCVTGQKPSLIDSRMSEDSTPIFKVFEDILRRLYSPNDTVSPFASEIFAG